MADKAASMNARKENQARSPGHNVVITTLRRASASVV